MIIFLLIKKKYEKTTAVMSSDFYFGHFVEVEDIPQSCMLSFPSQT